MHKRYIAQHVKLNSHNINKFFLKIFIEKLLAEIFDNNENKLINF